MSDDWIFPIKMLLIASKLLTFEIQTQELAAGVHPLEQSPQHFIHLRAVQDFQYLAGMVREGESPARSEEVVKGSLHGIRDDGQQPQGFDDPPLKKIVDSIDDAIKMVTRTKEDKEEERRESPERIAEQLAARQAELQALMDRQEQERIKQAKDIAGYEKNLKQRYSASPTELEQHRASLKEAAAEVDKKQSDRHASELQQFNERWEEKFQQFEEQPMIWPTDPSRDDR